MTAILPLRRPLFDFYHRNVANPFPNQLPAAQCVAQEPNRRIPLPNQRLHLLQQKPDLFPKQQGQDLLLGDSIDTSQAAHGPVTARVRVGE